MAQHTIIVESASQPAAQRKRRKAPLILAGVGLIALVPVIGSTFAANIALNGGSDIEFGQGSQQTVTCDNSITVTPTATFDAASDSWALGLSVSDIDKSACANKTFTVSTWNSSNTLADTWTFTPTGTSGSFTNGTFATSSTDYVATLNGSTLNAADLKTVTVESSN